MIKDILGKLKDGILLSEDEICELVIHMMNVHELDINHYGKGNIPRDASKISQIWCMAHTNYKNLIEIHRELESCLLEITFNDFIRGE